MQNFRNFTRNTKISLDQITFGPKHQVLDELEIFTVAGQLVREGYIGVSNAYCIIKRVDRDDWLQRLAKNMHLCVADFHNINTGVLEERWREHYIRVYSKDEHTVHPQIYDAMKKRSFGR